MLGAFLTSDVVGPNGARSFKKWIFDERYPDANSNFSFLEKEGNNIIIGCDHWVNDPYEWTFECTKNQLAYILDQWAELVPLRPKEIIIIQDGDSFIVEGYDFPSKNTKK